LVVQGDTISALAGAITSELLAIPFVHVEAGVRSRLRDDPFPEETSRRIISSITEMHVCFSEHTRENLLAEGVDPGTIVVAPHPARDRVDRVVSQHASRVDEGQRGRFAVLVTVHRRERRKARAETLMALMNLLRDKHPDLAIGFVWHPGLQADLGELRADLGDIGVEVVPPMPPDTFLDELAEAQLVITDSGGVAEEAQLLGRPLLILRSSAELRLDERPVASTCASESPQVAGAFALRSLAERATNARDERAARPPAGLVIASHVASFVRSLGGEATD